MIIYDLRCKRNHVFEGWFNSRAAFEEQKANDLIICPVCGTTEVNMVPSSISVLCKDAKEPVRENSKEISMMKSLQVLHHFLEKNFEDVGSRFAEIALKIQAGEEDRRNIKGTTTKEEEESLKEAGVEFIKIPVPKFDS